MVLSDGKIEQAKKDMKLSHPRHEHDDCIRMAYEWFDAQMTTEGARADDWKHIVERWCGRSVSDADVEIAAFMHPKIKGKYPKYNISKRLALPSSIRLAAIGQAGRQKQIMRVGNPCWNKTIESDH